MAFAHSGRLLHGRRFVDNRQITTNWSNGNIVKMIDDRRQTLLVDAGNIPYNSTDGTSCWDGLERKL